MSIACVLLAVGVATFPVAAGAQNGSIGVYGDAAATQSVLSLQSGTPDTLFIVARLEGQSAGGLTGSEFRVTGLPAAWIYSVSPNPEAVIAFGDPLAPSGQAWRANLAFASCQTGEDGTVLLYTVEVLPTTDVTDLILRVEAGDPPSNPTRDAPLVNLCDEPFYTTVLVEGRTTVINPLTLLHDFQVTPCDLGSSVPAPEPGQAIFFEAIIHNVGQVGAPEPVPVRFLLDGQPFGDDALVGPIPGESSVVATSSVAWNVDFDLHELTVVVDPEQLFESSIHNNEASVAMPWDLRVVPRSACEMFTPCSPNAGQTINLNATIQNSGLFTVDSVEVEFSRGGGTWSTRVLAVDVAGGCGSGVDVVTTDYVAQCFTNTVAVVVDPDDVLLEPNEFDNAFQQSIHVGTCDPEDTHDYLLRACDIVASDPAAMPGEEILLQATVINVGPNAAPGPTVVRFLLDGNPVGDDVPLAPLSPGGSVIVSAPWTVDHDPHLLSVYVDPDDAIPEVLRFNNQASVEMPWDFSIQTLLECLDGNPSCTPCPGDTLLVSALVSNQGLFSADSVLVSFVGVVPPSGVIGSSVVAHLPARTVCSIPVRTSPGFPIIALHGSNTVQGRVDPANEWQEYRESNNSNLGIQAVDCEPPTDSEPTVDLELVHFDYVLTSDQPGGVLQSIEVLVRKTGTANALGTPFVGFVDGVPVCVGTLDESTPLPGGAFLLGECFPDWVVPAPAAEHILLVCVDPGQQVPETDEGNNCRSEVLEETGQGVPVSLTDLEATSDETGLVLRWRVIDAYAQLGVDRRAQEGIWQRRAVVSRVQAQPDGYADHRFLDRDVSPGESYQYRILGIDDRGNEMILGSLTAVFSPAVPNRFVLYPPAPNPFNPSTRVRFSIPRAQHADVRILDTSGRLVRLLWSGNLDAGMHDFIWRGEDERGDIVSSGIYFCTVRVARGTETRKLVLLK